MSDDTSLFLMSLKDKIPSDSLFYLKESLEKASGEQRQKLFFVKIKNPLYGLLFSFILPGLDRIYKGDIILGVIKMIFAIFSYLGLIISIGKNNNDVDITAVIVSYYTSTPYLPYTPSISEPFFLFLVIVAAIWVFADYFLVWKGICKDNLRRIFEVLQ